MEQSFYADAHDIPGKYIEPAPELPSLVIIDVSTSITEFNRKIDELDELGIITFDAVADVLTLISRRHEAEINIQGRRYSVLWDIEQEVMKDEVLKYLVAWEQFARDIYKNIEALGLYRNNYLHYQLSQVKPSYLILEKMHYPSLNDELFKRFNITRWRSDPSNARLV